jgi:hypothetical protein
MDVAIKVCFADFYDIAVPPCRNANPVRDLPFCGSNKESASAYPIKLDS